MVSDTNKQYISSKSIFMFLYVIAILFLSIGLFLPYPANFIPILIPIGILFVIVILKFPFYGLLIYSIFLLIRPQEFLSILSNLPVPLEKVSAILLLITLFVKLKIEKQLKFSFTTVDKSLLSFLFVTFLSMIFSIWISKAWETWYRFFTVIIVYFMIIYSIETKKQLEYFIIFIIFTSVFHAGTSILNYYNGVYEYRMGIKRAIGMDQSYSNPNSLAATLSYTLPFLYYTFNTYKNPFYKIITVTFSVLLLWCIILTGSRTGMAGVIFISIILMWHSKNKIINFSILMLLGLMLWVIMPSQYQQRFLSTTDISSDTGAAESAHGRIDGLVNGFLLMIDRPLLGFGIGCFGTANGMLYGRSWYQAHSLPGQIMGELGLIGVIAFILWIYYLFKNLKFLKVYKFKNNNFNVKFLLISLKIQLMSLLFFGLGGHNLYRYNWLIISAIIVVLLNLYKKDKELSSNFYKEKDKIIGDKQ